MYRNLLWIFYGTINATRICLRRQKFLCLSCFRKVRLSLLCNSPIILYGCTYLLAPIGVRFFASPGSTVFDIAVSGLRLYGLGFLFSGINIFAAIRMMTYGKGYISGMITFLRSFALLLLFLTILPRFLELNGIWLAIPAAEILTLVVALWTLRKKTVA